MNRYQNCCIPLVLIALVVSFGTAGCDDKSAPGAKSEAKVSAAILGKYENANDKMSLELKSGNKVTLTDEGKSTDLTWEMDGSQKVVIHGQEGINLTFTINSEGNLSDGMGGVFRKK